MMLSMAHLSRRQSDTQAEGTDPAHAAGPRCGHLAEGTDPGVAMATTNRSWVVLSQRHHRHQLHQPHQQ